MRKHTSPLFNPLLAPMMIASATTIALRTMLMWPTSGRLTAWQQKEAAKMVQEKAAAVREAQAEAIAIAWAAVWTPWTVWMSGQSAPKAFDQAATRILQPFSGRASSNARRLTARAMRPMLDAVPIVVTAPTAALASVSRAKPTGIAEWPIRRRRSAR